jgi:hypothetical protein
MADMAERSRDVRYVPITDKAHRSKFSYSITSSTMASTSGGTVMSSARAV